MEKPRHLSLEKNSHVVFCFVLFARFVQRGRCGVQKEGDHLEVQSPAAVMAIEPVAPFNQQTLAKIASGSKANQTASQ